MLIPKTRKEIYQAYLSGDTHLELPKPVTRDEIILYNACINGAGTNPSWNDLTDKPFGETVELTELVPVTTLTVEPYDKLGGLPTVDQFPPIDIFEVGQPCVVTFDGTDYPCTPVSFLEGESVLVGNASLLSALIGPAEDTGEPFVIFKDSGYAFVTKEAGTYTVSISAKSETIKPLDPKYIVLTSPNGKKFNLSVSDSGTLSATAAT